LLLYRSILSLLFLLTAAAPPAIYTLSLHDALPISKGAVRVDPILQNSINHGLQRSFQLRKTIAQQQAQVDALSAVVKLALVNGQDRKSTRLNSSHVKISYAVFCLKKKKKEK